MHFHGSEHKVNKKYAVKAGGVASTLWWRALSESLIVLPHSLGLLHELVEVLHKGCMASHHQ